MKRPALPGIAIAITSALYASPLLAQVLHVNDRWDNCAMVIDPSLTQEAWHQFVTEAGLVVYFHPMTSARPLGPRHFEVALLRWSTMIDDANPAWNDTFSHPDAAHWLFDGNSLPIPGLMLRVGVTQKLDLGAYWTSAPSANYSMIGGQAQYDLLDDPNRGLAGAGRISAVKIYGPEDLGVTTYGLDFLVSKQIDRFSPYVGVGGYWSRGHETTSKVDLEDESVLGALGTAGIAVRVWLLSLGAEFNVAKVSSYGLKVGFAS